MTHLSEHVQHLRGALLAHHVPLSGHLVRLLKIFSRFLHMSQRLLVHSECSLLSSLALQNRLVAILRNYDLVLEKILLLRVQSRYFRMQVRDLGLMLRIARDLLLCGYLLFGNLEGGGEKQGGKGR